MNTCPNMEEFEIKSEPVLMNPSIMEEESENENSRKKPRISLNGEVDVFVKEEFDEDSVQRHKFLDPLAEDSLFMKVEEADVDEQSQYAQQLSYQVYHPSHAEDEDNAKQRQFKSLNDLDPLTVKKATFVVTRGYPLTLLKKEGVRKDELMTPKRDRTVLRKLLLDHGLDLDGLEVGDDVVNRLYVVLGRMKQSFTKAKRSGGGKGFKRFLKNNNKYPYSFKFDYIVKEDTATLKKIEELNKEMTMLREQIKTLSKDQENI